MPRKERQRMMFTGDLVGGSGYRGASTVASGDAFIVVSASAILSGSPVLFGLSHVTANSGQDLALEVDSIVDNTSFLAITEGELAVNEPQPFTYLIVR